MGGGGSRPSPDGARSFRNAILARIRGGTRRGARSPAPVHPLQARARRVVVKAHLLRMGPTAAKAAALHVRYIERDGVEKDGSKGMLYDAQGRFARGSSSSRVPARSTSFVSSSRRRTARSSTSPPTCGA